MKKKTAYRSSLVSLSEGTIRLVTSTETKTSSADLITNTSLARERKNPCKQKEKQEEDADRVFVAFFLLDILP